MNPERMATERNKVARLIRQANKAYRERNFLAATYLYMLTMDQIVLASENIRLIILRRICKTCEDYDDVRNGRIYVWAYFQLAMGNRTYRDDNIPRLMGWIRNKYEQRHI